MTFDQIEIYFHIGAILCALLAVLCFSAIAIADCTTPAHKPARLRNTGKRARHISKRATYRQH